MPLREEREAALHVSQHPAAEPPVACHAEAPSERASRGHAGGWQPPAVSLQECRARRCDDGGLAAPAAAARPHKQHALLERDRDPAQVDVELLDGRHGMHATMCLDDIDTVQARAAIDAVHDPDAGCFV